MLSFIRAIPSRSTVGPGERLNVLGGVVNDGPSRLADISVWANAGDGWRRLIATRFALAEGEHKHLYFTLEPEMFSPELWGEAPEALALAIQDTRPEPDAKGAVVFIE